MREKIKFKEEISFKLNGKPVEPGKTPPLPKTEPPPPPKTEKKS